MSYLEEIFRNHTRLGDAGKDDDEHTTLEN